MMAGAPEAIPEHEGGHSRELGKAQASDDLVGSPEQL